MMVRGLRRLQSQGGWNQLTLFSSDTFKSEQLFNSFCVVVVVGRFLTNAGHLLQNTT